MSIRDINYESRHSLPDEIATMELAARRLPPEVVAQVEAMFCDSKLGVCYIVTLKPDRPDEHTTASEIRKAFTSLGGHNGLIVNRADGSEVVDFGPWWPEEDGDRCPPTH